MIDLYVYATLRLRIRLNTGRASRLREDISVWCTAGMNYYLKNELSISISMSVGS